MKQDFGAYRDELDNFIKSRLFDVAWSVWRMGKP